MYLKSLTAFGFKSFADKTTLDFLPGITAIVGPNGCGKSNVADAIRWVLGEQSAKALRGGEMADVIFSGTASRKPLGMAEVSLTIGEVDQDHLRAAGVDLDFNELTVSRRVFRDGGSQYFINKTACRLKDIQQLFMGTGIGRSSYSIMAQGHITQILSSKPEERRAVFEEAAGITKYKAQKREALRKLDYTEQNLLRVGDLVREIKRQIGSLQRQAGKAKRHKQLSVQLQYLETQFARHQYDVLLAEISERQETLGGLQARMEADSSTVMTCESELAESRKKLAELEREIRLVEQKSMELKAENDQALSHIEFGQERLTELEERGRRATTEITESDERRRVAQEEQENVGRRLEEAGRELETRRIAFEEKRKALGAVDERMRQQQGALEQAHAEAFQVAQQASEINNELRALEFQDKDATNRLEKLSHEKIQLEEERTALKQELSQFEEALARKEKEISLLEEQVERGRGQVQELDSRLTEGRESYGVRLRRQAEARAQQTLLSQLDAHREGFDSGAMEALKQAEAILGSLSDRIRVDDRYVKSVEAVLGEHVQLLLVERPEDARQILGELTDKGSGVAAIACLTLARRLNGAAGVATPPPNARSLVDLVHCDEAVSPLVHSLLRRAFLVDNLDVALRGWRATGGELDFVTPEGALLTRHGVFRGGVVNGASEKTAVSSILGRKNELERLNAELKDLDRQVEDTGATMETLAKDVFEAQTEHGEAQAAHQEKRIGLAADKGRLNALGVSARTLDQKIETVVYEIRSLSDLQEEGRRTTRELSQGRSVAEERRVQCDMATKALSARIESIREERESANSEWTEAKVDLATTEQLRDSFSQQQGPLEQRLEELRQLARSRQDDLRSFGEKRTRIEGEIVEVRGRMALYAQERQDIDRRRDEVMGRRQAAGDNIERDEERLKAIREVVSEVQDQRNRVEIDIAERRVGVDNLKERIQRSYEIDLEELRGEGFTVTFAEGGKTTVETMTPEEIEASGVATDWEAVRKHIEALQTRINNMGPVNMVAIEEYEEMEERYEFLDNQYQDLLSAKEHLESLLSKINKQTKEMFSDTFERIRSNFQEMFVEIFGGGKADLTLIDDKNVLESGIDIVARPPGKRLQGISLLSGGEQTMTAVALLFAIYQVKPSPFCVLDELDAPLDDSNIVRFTRILSRFLAHSQFVIITHNKRTISMADVLYGVTMQEQGVSKIVGVNFQKWQDNGQNNGDHDEIGFSRRSSIPERQPDRVT